MSGKSRNSFKMGDKIRLRDGIRKQGVRNGIVAATPTKPNLIPVIWNGNRSIATYHIDLIERVNGGPYMRRRQ